MSGLGAAKQSKRRRELVDEIIRNPGVMIRELAEKLQVSRETIRRDIDALCEDGQLQRRYGGAMVVPVGNILSFEARQEKHVRERKAIARKAHSLLRDNQVIMLAPGTTALLFAMELTQTEKNLTIITNGIREAQTLTTSDSLRVVMAPGEIDRQEGFVWGHDTAEYIARFNADLTVFFADGLAWGGVSEADSRTAWTIKTMLAHSQKNMLLIDHFRFGQQGLQKICSLEELDTVVSDREPDAELRGKLRKANVAFHRS